MQINLRVRAPISEEERRQLKADAKDLRGAAKRKGFTLDSWDESLEKQAAKDHFELGCWLFYYRKKTYEDAAIEDRIDCARRIFMAGFQNPHYEFFTVFEFGERNFDSLFEMGDSSLVIQGLRELMDIDKTGNLREAFKYFGWSTEHNADDAKELKAAMNECVPGIAPIPPCPPTPQLQLF